MSITYCLHFDERYGVESLKKHRTVVQSRWARWTLKIVCGLGLVTLGALGTVIKSFVVCGTAVGFLGLLAFAPQIDYLILHLRWRKHSQYGSTMNVELSDENLKFASRESDSVFRWSSFVSAAGFADGLLLYMAPWQYVWLPNSGLQTGDAAQARAIAKAKVAKYHGV
jgi:hypothetical protein